MFFFAEKKMMKHYVLAGMFLFCATAQGENLLKNPDFKELSPARLPLHWEVRGKADAITRSENGLKIAASNDTLLIQWELPLRHGRNYKVNFTVRGKGAYRIYGEYEFLRDGRKNLRGVNSAWQEATATWEEHSFFFTLPETGE